MVFGKKKGAIPDPVIEEPTDPLSWIVNNEFASFVLMNTNEIVSGNQEGPQLSDWRNGCTHESLGILGIANGSGSIYHELERVRLDSIDKRTTGRSMPNDKIANFRCDSMCTIESSEHFHCSPGTTV